MNKFLVVLNAINGILFIAIGLLWVISPNEAGANFGILEISEGLGRSSLIGDVGSYFFLYWFNDDTCSLYSKKYLVLCARDAFGCHCFI